ncbi:MAG: class I SAM-dependent methyltransferase [Actinomycetota bacterium]|nr:class I SAM-dependent methyltransferase [Actinomycetota bacterium]
MSGSGSVEAFDRRAEDYERGPRARFHFTVTQRTADLALEVTPLPLRVLDVGCGTGMLLREMVARIPNAIELVGADPAERMLAVARTRAEGNERFVECVAEDLPFASGHFDLVISTTSFDHWGDQSAGLAEVRRVLRPGGTFVLADICAAWLSESRGQARARTPHRVVELLERTGLSVVSRRTIYRIAGLPLVRAFVARPAVANDPTDG